jgi:hypothetical protein
MLINEHESIYQECIEQKSPIKHLIIKKSFFMSVIVKKQIINLKYDAYNKIVTFIN